MKRPLGTRELKIFSGQREPTGMTSLQRQSITTGLGNSEGLKDRLKLYVPYHWHLQFSSKSRRISIRLLSELPK